MSKGHSAKRSTTANSLHTTLANHGSPNVRTTCTSSESFLCEPLFKLIEETFNKEGPKYVKKVKAVYAFNVVDGPDGKKERWLVDVKHGSGSVQKGGKGKADCTFTMKDKDLFNLMSGKLQPQSAFFSGKLKIIGNMGLAMRLQQIMPKHPLAKL